MYKTMLLFCCLLILSSCSTKKLSTTWQSDMPAGTKATQRPYTVFGQRYEPLQTHERFVQTGMASWYGKDFHGKKTSNGEKYDMYAQTAAHKTLPLGVYVRVYNIHNRRETVVRINDRGPFVKGRIIDLSYAAAKTLGVDIAGTAFVRIEALGYRQTDAADTASIKQPVYNQGTFTVQVGSFKEQGNAQRLSGEMKKRFGFSDIRLTDVNGELFYRVYAGRYTTLESAEQAEEKFAELGYAGSFVVSLD